MKLAPALVPLEVWFWYMLLLDLLSAKPCLRFLIKLIEKILHTIKVGEILLSQSKNLEKNCIYSMENK
jgi:hypothetical protein